MRMRVAVLLVAALATAQMARADGVAFQYRVDSENSQSPIEFSDLKGFDVSDGLRLKVRLSQSSYCYLIMSDPKGRYRLAFPDPEAANAGLPSNEWAKLPKVSFVRLGQDPSVDRVFLVVSRKPVPELEGAVVREHGLSLAVADEVKERYSPAGNYTRGLEGDTVSVKYRPRKAPAVVVEEISLRK